MKFLRRLLPDAFDLLHIVGLAAIVWGVWQLSHAAAWIVGGLAAIGYSVLGSVGGRVRQRLEEMRRR